MWSWIQPIADYLKSTSLGRKLIDALLIIIVGSWALLAVLIGMNATTIMALVGARYERVQVRPLVELNERIDAELSTVMGRLGADRVALDRFHDNMVDVSNRHFIFFSRTNEADQPGIGSSISRRQNVLISIISPLMNDLVQGRCVARNPIEKNDSLTSYFSEIGTRAVVACPILDSTGSLIGIISTEYVVRSPGDIALIERALQSSALRLSGMLSVQP